MNIIFLLLATIPHEHVVDEQVDAVELNHLYDEEGRLRYDQVLFYDENGQIIDTRQVVPHRPGLVPQLDRPRSQYSSLWNDRDGKMRRVRSNIFRETWTQHDPEEQGHPHPLVRQLERRLLLGSPRPKWIPDPEPEECECCQ